MSRSRTRVHLEFLLTILCLISVFTTACSGTSSSQKSGKAPANKQTLVYPLNGYADVSSIDPAVPNDLASGTIINMLYTGLVTLDNQLKVQPQLAQSYEISNDGTIYTFHLRPNLKFSDGAPLTSTDVAYSIDRALQKDTASNVAGNYLVLIKGAADLNAGKTRTIIGTGITTPNKDTVIITIEKKAAYFLDALTYGCSYVVEKSLVQKYGKQFTDHLDEGSSTGPFKMQSYKHKQQIVLVPNENYYGPKPQISKLVIPFYEDVLTGYKAYQTNQVDYVSSFPTNVLPDARSRGNEYQQIPVQQINYYAMNYLAKPFDNIHIRQAFALAINKSEITHSIYKDLYTPTNHFVPMGVPGYNPDLKAIDGSTGTNGNPGMAKKLFAQGMQEEGYKSIAQFPQLTLSYQTGGHDSTNEILAVTQMWQKTLGVTVKPQAEEFQKQLDEINGTVGNPDGLKIWTTTWIADYPDPQDWITLQFDEGPANNSNYGHNPNASIAAQQQAIQRQMRAADANQNPDARLLSYNRIEQQLVNDVAWIPVEQPSLPVMTKPYVQGLIVNSTNLTPPDEWSKVYILNH